MNHTSNPMRIPSTHFQAIALPHTPHLLDGDWPYDYPQSQAYFPLPWVESDKFWPPVARVDNVWGDRHLVAKWPREGEN